MDSKISEYRIEKIDPSEFGKLDLKGFLKELKENNVEISAVIPLKKGSEFAEYILEDLLIDPEECILYSEHSEGIIYYDEDNDEMAFGDYKYLVIFKEKEQGYNEFVYWFSAYKNLENLSIELKLLD